jgi:hypothetical protein
VEVHMTIHALVITQHTYVSMINTHNTPKPITISSRNKQCNFIGSYDCSSDCSPKSILNNKNNKMNYLLWPLCKRTKLVKVTIGCIKVEVNLMFEIVVNLFFGKKLFIFFLLWNSGSLSNSCEQWYDRTNTKLL